MGEWVDQWAAEDKRNIWGKQVSVVEMQSEAGAAGAVHGMLAAGSLTTTYTASQGLLLMIPNMYKIAGELLPTVFHVTARSLACQSLAIFGDHSDVMACRNTGFAMLAAASVQEEHDMALVRRPISKVPFLSSSTASYLAQNHKYEAFVHTIATMIDKAAIEVRARAMKPEIQSAKSGAKWRRLFQGRETVNKFYDACGDIVQEKMDQLALSAGVNTICSTMSAPDRDVIVSMGSRCEAIEETVNYECQAWNQVRSDQSPLIVRSMRTSSSPPFRSPASASLS